MGLAAGAASPAAFERRCIPPRFVASRSNTSSLRLAVAGAALTTTTLGWMLLGFDPDRPGLHDELWGLAAETSCTRRQIYDARLALSLRRQGVAELATANVKDFQDVGFARVWNPVG